MCARVFVVQVDLVLYVSLQEVGDLAIRADRVLARVTFPYVPFRRVQQEFHFLLNDPIALEELLTELPSGLPEVA